MKADIAAHLKELLELEDDEIKEFYDAFIKEFDKSCVDLQEPGVDSDFQKLRIITHTMFGYCENMGAMDLFALAKELNAAAKAEYVPTCQASIRKIFQMHEAYLAEG